MNKNQIFTAVTELCNELDELIRKKDGFVDNAMPVAWNDIDIYSIESVGLTGDYKQIAIIVNFHLVASNVWRGKFYFKEVTQC